MTTHSNTSARICRIHERACIDQGDQVVCPVGPHVVRTRTWNPALREQQRATLREHAVEAGKKGGTARAAALTPEHRREIARQGSDARWGKRAWGKRA